MEQSVKTRPVRRTTPALREAERLQLRDCLVRVRQELNQAYAAFNMADDEDLVESCVFEINALQARYNYPLKQVKWMEGAE